MTKEEAQISVNRANEIEEWLKSEYADIHVDHLREVEIGPVKNVSN